MKECKNCKELLPLESYHKDKQTRDGYKYICKECQKIYRNRSHQEIVAFDFYE